MPKDKRFFYDEFADDFDGKVNMYDTNRRLELIFDCFLKEVDLKDKLFLDAGSGTGWFSRKASERGAVVHSMDVGVNILNQVAKKCDSHRTCGSALELPYKDDTFDVVMSTEVIEHTEEPYQAVEQLIRALKPGGILIITCPNRIWHFAIWIANALKLRPYEGYENWVTYGGLRNRLANNNIDLEVYRGFHLFPFIIGLFNPFLRFMDRYGKALGPVMLNIAAVGKKRAETEERNDESSEN